jgi:hypothetical protein
MWTKAEEDISIARRQLATSANQDGEGEVSSLQCFILYQSIYNVNGFSKKPQPKSFRPIGATGLRSLCALTFSSDCYKN